MHQSLSTLIPLLALPLAFLPGASALLHGRDTSNVQCSGSGSSQTCYETITVVSTVYVDLAATTTATTGSAAATTSSAAATTSSTTTTSSSTTATSSSTAATSQAPSGSSTTAGDTATSSVVDASTAGATTASSGNTGYQPFVKVATGTAGEAKITYHMYTASDSYTTVSCSDGQTGMLPTMGYTDLSSMFPYVTAWSQVQWNSPNCGACVKVTGTQSVQYLTVIDHCEIIDEYSNHFDIAPEAFTKLFGSLTAGHYVADYEIVAHNKCTGNTLSR